MDDDIWDDCDDVEYDKIMSERNYNRMNTINQNMGYIEGIDEGKVHTIQKSFENGFKIGFDNGFSLGEQYGEVSALKFLLDLENDKSEKVDSILNQFEEKFKDFKKVESLYEEKEKELKELNVKDNEEIFIPDEIKKFITENKTILESM